MANPHPVQTEVLKQKRFKRESKATFADSPTSVKLPIEPVDVRAIVKGLDDPAMALRLMIIEGLQRRGLLSETEVEALRDALGAPETL